MKPKTFSQLQAFATKGHFHWKRDLASSLPFILKGANLSQVAKAHEEPDAELITRLLNFAHTGGIQALDEPDLDASHDKLSALLEDEDAENDDIRDAAIDICAHLIGHYNRRRAALAILNGEAAS